MTTMITEACINCGACEPECPVDAILEGESLYVIDPLKCTDCVEHAEKRCEAVCPVDCCVPDPNADAKKVRAKGEATESDIDAIARQRGLTVSARYRRFLEANESARYEKCRSKNIPTYGSPMKVSWLKPSAPLLRKNDLEPDAFPEWVPLAHVSAVGELEILLVNFTSEACPVAVLLDGQLSSCAKSLDAFLSALIPNQSPA